MNAASYTPGQRVHVKDSMRDREYDAVLIEYVDGGVWWVNPDGRWSSLAIAEHDITGVATSRANPADMAAAHAEGYHDEPREGCPECER